MRCFKRAAFVIATMILMFFIAYNRIPGAAAQSASDEAARIAAEAAAKAKALRDKAEADRKEAEADAAAKAAKDKADAAAATKAAKDKADADAKAAREKADADAKAAAERIWKSVEADADAKAAKEKAAAAAAEPVWKSFNTDMVLVQGGTFTMGCTPEQGNDCYREETPTQEVTLNDFYIGKFTVTLAQWRVVMGNNSSGLISGNLPVEEVSWNEVQEFIKRLNERTNGNYRLPTEAEWEYAARGGNQSQGYKYSGSNNIEEVAWYESNSGKKTHPVGTKKANELGIHDMSGNVYEWVNDWYGEYSGGRLTNPQGPSSGSHRVIHGGSYSTPDRSARVSYRYRYDPGIRYGFLGFRLARSSN